MSMYSYTLMHIHIIRYTYIYIYIYIYIYNQLVGASQCSIWRRKDGATANLPTNIVDFRGFDSSIVLI